MERLRHPGIQFSLHQVEHSFLEAAFSRGDRRLGAVLERAVDLGCQFDSWGDQLRFESWLQAFREAGLDPAEYAQRFIDPQDPLPWDHLSPGVDKSSLSGNGSSPSRACPRRTAAGIAAVSAGCASTWR